jgi:hypothetical protein
MSGTAMRGRVAKTGRTVVEIAVQHVGMKKSPSRNGLELFSQGRNRGDRHIMHQGKI